MFLQFRRLVVPPALGQSAVLWRVVPHLLQVTLVVEKPQMTSTSSFHCSSNAFFFCISTQATKWGPSDSPGTGFKFQVVLALTKEFWQ